MGRVKGCLPPLSRFWKQCYWDIIHCWGHSTETGWPLLLPPHTSNLLWMLRLMTPYSWEGCGEVSYSCNESLWGEQGSSQTGPEPGLGFLWWLAGGARVRVPEWSEFPPGTQGGNHLECPFSLVRYGTGEERSGGMLKTVGSKTSIVESGSLFTNCRTHLFKMSIQWFLVYLQTIHCVWIAYMWETLNIFITPKRSFVPVGNHFPFPGNYWSTFYLGGFFGHFI